MLFGALALATSTAVTSCKDYDDDVTHLQEQIDKITSNNPVSAESMKAAIEEAKAALQAKLDDIASSSTANKEDIAALKEKAEKLQELIDAKADAGEIAKLTEEISALSKKIDEANAKLKEDLEGKIASLESELEETNKKLEQAGLDHATKAELEKEVGQINDNIKYHVGELNKLIAGHTQTIIDLQTQIAKLATIEKQIEGLQAFEKDVNAFLGTAPKDYGTIVNFVDEKLKNYTTVTLDPAIKEAITNALAENGEISKYVSGVVEGLKTTLMPRLTGVESKINDLLDNPDSKLNKLVTDYNTFVTETYTKDQQKINNRLNTLESWKNNIETTITNNATVQDALTKAQKAVDALGKIENLETEFAKYATTEALSTAISDNYTNVLEPKFNELKDELKELGMDIDALGKILQNVVYIPSDESGSEEFITIFAKANATAAFDDVSKSEDIKIRFRVSPASAITKAKDLDNYEFGFDGQKFTRAADAFDCASVEYGDEPGIIVITMKANKAISSQVAALTIKGKKAEVAEGEYSSDYKTDITSNYFNVEMKSYWLRDAKVVLADEKVDKEIIYNDATSKHDYSTVGKIQLGVTTSESNDFYFDYLDINKFAGCADFVNKFGIKYEVSNGDKFQVSESGEVSLTKYGIPSYLEAPNTGAVTATATSEYYITDRSNTPAQLGTVTIVIDTKKAEVDYGKIEFEWSAAAQSEVLNTSTIYNDPKVLLTQAEFNTLTGTAETGKVQFTPAKENGVNTLKVDVAATAEEGTYPIVAKYTAEGREITVKATVVIKAPAYEELIPDEHFWKDGAVKLTPTLNNSNRPSTISLDFDLSKLFTNYREVETAVEAKGGTFTLSVDTKEAIGLTYTNTTLSYDKNTYEEGTAQPQITATIKFGNKVYQEFKGTINMTDLSGVWVAPTKRAYTLDDKNITYDIAKGFGWNDISGRKMWKDGTEVTNGENTGDFAEDVKGLEFYGLNAPTYIFVDANGQETTSEYLTLTENKVEFTQAGKDFNFVQDYTIRVKVVAASRWGEIAGYEGNNIITLTIPANN